MLKLAGPQCLGAVPHIQRYFSFPAEWECAQAGDERARIMRGEVHRHIEIYEVPPLDCVETTQFEWEAFFDEADQPALRLIFWDGDVGWILGEFTGAPDELRALLWQVLGETASTLPVGLQWDEDGEPVVHRETIPATTQLLVLKRDKFTCQYCGRSAPEVELHIDHRLPVSRGGTNDPENLCVACKACNLSKRAKTDIEFLAQEA